MPILDDIRQKYPQYHDLPDAELANKLYTKFYSDMPRAEFDQKVGLPAVDPMLSPAASPAQEQAKDIGRGILRGGARAFEAPPFQPPGTAGQFVQSPAETAAAIEQARGTGPGVFAEKHVSPPVGVFGQYAEPIAAGALTAPLQPGGPITKAITTIGGAVGAKAGGDLAAALDLPEAVGAIVGGGIGGGAAGLGAAETQRLRLAWQLPTTARIRAGAKAAYRLVQDDRLIVHEGAVNGLASSLRAGLDQQLLTDVAPRTMRGVAQLQASGGDIAGMMGVRENLGKIKPDAGADYEAAQHVRDAIDHFIETLPPSEVVQGDAPYTQALLDDARSAWRAYAKLDQIHTAMEIGEHRAAVAGTGANTQNAMRQRIREILDSEGQSRGFSDASREQMENIVMGTWLTNRARWAGKFAPSGPVSALTTMGSALTTEVMGGGHGLALTAGAAIAIPATIAKYLGTFLTRRQIRMLEDTIRGESPMGRQIGQRIAAQPRAVAPVAAARGALAAGAGSLLADQPEPVAEPGP